MFTNDELSVIEREFNFFLREMDDAPELLDELETREFSDVDDLDFSDVGEV